MRLFEGIPGMTPARFDLLCLLRQAGLWRGMDRRSDALTQPMRQREIWQRLDLCRTTVSKMLTRLEEMGWVRREMHPDRKNKLVFFTAEGLRATWKAMKILFRQRTLLQYFERIARRRWPEKRPVQAVYDLWEDIDYVALCFGDRSRIDYDMGINFELDEEIPIIERERFFGLYKPPTAPKRAKKRPREAVRPLGYFAWPARSAAARR